MGSRRESRTVNVRQNDALEEFENFKKKFLLANKHITKLNSTLSVRIEDLNAQISILSADNLRLRASEVALTAQLRREREKSRKIMADAEAATQALARHLSSMRHSYGIPVHEEETPPPSSPVQRARRPPAPDPNATPPPNRLARPPSIPGINEEEEPECHDPPTTSTNNNALATHKTPASPATRKRRRARLSASRLPLPSRMSTPPPAEEYREHDVESIAEAGVVEEPNSPAATSRRAFRRRSGFVSTGTTASDTASTATEQLPLRALGTNPELGEPIGRAVQDDMMTRTAAAAAPMTEPNATFDVTVEAKKKRRETSQRQAENVIGEGRPIKLESVGDGIGQQHTQKSKLKDVTNSPRATRTMPSIVARPTLDVRSSSPLVMTSPEPSSPTTQEPTTWRTSSPIPPPADDLPAREASRRTRKSINYAEPKLNTKMRKPRTDNDKPRRSGGGDDQPRHSLEPKVDDSVAPTVGEPGSRSPVRPPRSSVAMRRKKPRPQIMEDGDGDDDDDLQADQDFTVPTWAHVEGRRRSALPASNKKVDVDDIRRRSMNT